MAAGGREVTLGFRHQSIQCLSFAGDRPGVVLEHGGRIEVGFPEEIVDVVKRKVPGWTPGYNNFVDVRDVARSMIAAWRKGRRGERYILGGHDLTYRAVFEQIAAIAGVRAPRWRVPRLAAAALGLVGDLQERFFDRVPLITSTSVRYAFTDRFRFSSEKARRELDHAVTPLEVAIHHIQ